MSAQPHITGQPIHNQPPAAKLAPQQRHLTAVPQFVASEDAAPDPSVKFLRALTTQAFEVVEGRRSVAQLGGSITVGVAKQLELQRALACERRNVYRAQKSTLQSVSMPIICRVNNTVAEVAIVVSTNYRVLAVAIRVEWFQTRWRASNIVLL